MQADIDYLTNWVFESGKSFNIDKCWSVTFGQPIKHEDGRSYGIKGVSIPHKNIFKDLGVTVSSPLSFNSFIDDVVGRAFRRLGLIYKLFVSKNPKTIVRLYKSFVRPILEYASVIWNPHTQTNTNKIERVQKRLCRMFPEVRHLSYRE